MSRLDGTAKRTSNAILHALLENAAAKTSTERQINTDKPEEAPKEEKEALVKKVQKPEVPHKEHIVEGEDLEECGQVTSVELNEEADGLAEEKIAQLQEKIADLQAYLDATPEVPEDERASIQAEIDEMLDEINYFENSLNESALTESFNHINDVWSYLEQSKNEDDLKKRISDIPSKFGTFTYEIINDGATARVRNDYEEYDDYYYDEVDIDFLDDSFNESLTEAENPENAEINRKILNTIKTKADAEPKFKKDLEDAGLKVNKEFGEWHVEGPNGRRLSKYDITGGKDANFNPEERRHADWLNLLTKERDLNKNYRTMKNRAYKPTQRIDKYKHWNDETKSWEPGVDYGLKNYDRRQKRSQGYDFNNLRRGTQDIQDFKQAKDDEGFHHRAQKWSEDDIVRANKELADFQASISDKIAQLQRNIERAKEDLNKHVAGEENAIQTRKDILNKKRETRNK